MFDWYNDINWEEEYREFERAFAEYEAHLAIDAQSRDGDGHELAEPDTDTRDIGGRWQRQADREDDNAARQHPNGL